MNKRITGSSEAGVAICRALRIDPKSCTGIEFSIRPSELVTVTVHRHVYEHEAKALARVFERFNLVPAEDAPKDARALADEAVGRAITGGVLR